AVRNKKWVNLRTVKAHPNFMAKRLRTEFKRHEPTLVCAQPSVTKRILKEIKSWVREDRYAVVNPKHVYTEKKIKPLPRFHTGGPSCHPPFREDCVRGTVRALHKLRQRVVPISPTVGLVR